MKTKEMKISGTEINWYLAYEVLYFEEENYLAEDDDIVVWENLILVKAEDAQEAFEKAISGGKLNEGDVTIDGKQGRCKFAGLSRLIPIYEEIVDGAELEWKESQLTMKELADMIPPKNELLAFTLSKEN